MKFCECGKPINNPKFDKCLSCRLKEKKMIFTDKQEEKNDSGVVVEGEEPSSSFGIGSLIVISIAGAIGLFTFSSVYNSLNTSTLGGAVIQNVVPLIIIMFLAGIAITLIRLVFPD